MRIFIVCLILIVGTLKAEDNPVKPTNISSIPEEAFWVKSEVGIWMASYNVWYKVDKKTNTLKCSYNKKKWKLAVDAVWHDNQGKWYCINQNKMMSSDNGKKWEEVKNRSWQDMNGVWFRFDNHFNLYQVIQ